MKLGFIGVGKITSSLVQAYCTASIPDLQIFLSPRNADNASRLSEQYSVVSKMQSNQEVVDQADVVFLAVLPGAAREVAQSLRFREHQLVISMIPFLRLPELQEVILPASRAVRAIPLPSVVNHNCPIPVLNGDKEALELFDHIGQPLEMKTEDELHTIWTLTGFITPFYDMMGTLSNWAIDHGVTPATANQYIVDMFESLANAAQVSSPIDLEALAKHAATPKGMNEQTGIEIKAKGAHQAYSEAADGILERIQKNLLESTAKVG